MKKTICLLVLCLLIIVCFAACASETQDNGTAYLEFKEGHYDESDYEMILEALGVLNVSDSFKLERAENCYELYLSELWKNGAAYTGIEGAQVVFPTFAAQAHTEDSFQSYAVIITDAGNSYMIYDNEISSLGILENKDTSEFSNEDIKILTDEDFEDPYYSTLTYP